MRVLDVKQSGIVESVGKVGGKIVISQSQDVEAVLKENAIKRNQSSSDWKGDMHHVASIPMIMVGIWNKELRDVGADNGNCLAEENKAFFMGKITDYNYSKLRVKEGAL